MKMLNLTWTSGKDKATFAGKCFFFLFSYKKNYLQFLYKNMYGKPQYKSLFNWTSSKKAFKEPISYIIACVREMSSA